MERFASDLRQLEPFAMFAAEEFVGGGVVERFGLSVQPQLLAGAPGDVAGVTHQRTDVTRIKFLVERFALAAANGVEKVADVNLLGLSQAAAPADR